MYLILKIIKLIFFPLYLCLNHSVTVSYINREGSLIFFRFLPAVKPVVIELLNWSHQQEGISPTHTGFDQQYN